jgi:hypothetical protein
MQYFLANGAGDQNKRKTGFANRILKTALLWHGFYTDYQ